MNIESQKYVAHISYAGTGFCGWQRQKGAAGEKFPSIQATLEEALAKITGERVSVIGSGRTDSGVHALGQCAHFSLKKKLWEVEILKKAFNSLLPPQIRVKSLQKVAPDFHAQRSAIKKQYSYYFQQGPCALPHLEPYSWWIHKRLNLAAMREAVRMLIGEHDFKPFRSSGAKPGPTVRKILEAEILEEVISFPGGDSQGFSLIRVRIVGTGFLKQMVRGISGTLLQIGEEYRPPQDMQKILNMQDRKLVGPTAPGRGLWLEQVWYGEG